MPLVFGDVRVLFLELLLGPFEDLEVGRVGVEGRSHDEGGGGVETKKEQTAV